ncbi:MAG TPA: MarR family transcriptional regulator [Firmicutes bacterium]|nr:MarR family transcriptional regulator [Bacillota bacterium]
MENSHPLESLFVSVIKLHFKRTQMIFTKMGIYPGQPPILFALWRRDGLTQKELSDEAKVRPATMSVILQRLEKAGFVVRKPDLEDLRCSRVYLTDRGRGIRTELETALHQVEQEMFAGFTQEEMSQAKTIFMKIRDNLRQVVQEEYHAETD